MKHLIIVLALVITTSTSSWAQENAQDRLSEVIEQQGQAKALETLKQGWVAYKLGEYEAALSLWMPLAETGNASAQVFIGLMYNQGHAVDQDRNEAAKWYALASEQGHAPAKWRLAMLYYHGSGLTKDYQKAADLYHSAARQGDIYSQKALGVMYSKGFGVLKDNVIAYSWFLIASENGYKLAKKFQNKLAIEMTSEETTIAKAMAKRCMHSNYIECGWALSFGDNPNKDDS